MSSWFKDCASTCWRDSFSASCTLGSLCSMPRFCAVVAITSSVVNCCAICCFAVGGSSDRRFFGTTAFTIFSNSALVITVLQLPEAAAALPAAPSAEAFEAAVLAGGAPQRCLMVMTAVSGGRFAPGSFSAGLASSGLAAGLAVPAGGDGGAAAGLGVCFGAL